MHLALYGFEAHGWCSKLLLSAFCIQPHILVRHLTRTFNLDSGLISWLIDFLTDRPQKLRVRNILLDVLLSSTVSPPPPSVCPFPTLVLYTNECQSLYQDGHIIKFADDSVIVSLCSTIQIVTVAQL